MAKSRQFPQENEAILARSYVAWKKGYVAEEF